MDWPAGGTPGVRDAGWLIRVPVVMPGNSASNGSIKQMSTKHDCASAGFVVVMRAGCN